MKIVLFHPVHLPPKDYGGVERVVLWLAEALRDQGHQVYLAALEGSIAPKGIELISIPAGERSAADLPKRLPPGIDVVHFQAPPEAGFQETCQIPFVTTIHGNGKPGEVYAPNSIFISCDHATRHGRKSFIYNGVNPAEFHLAPKKKRSPLFLSKTSLKTKNLRGAFQIANHADMALTIAGGYRPLNLYLRAILSRHHWVGPVAGEKKANVLAEASALLFPVQWAEPFGLVMVEAFLSGTPVVGAAIGSVPEIIGEFGGRAMPVSSSLDDWKEALIAVEKIDPEFLRDQGIQRFSHQEMARNYVAAYQRVIQGEVL